MALDLGDDRQRRLRQRAVGLAIVSLTLLVALAWFWKAPQVEDDIEDRAQARLRLNGLPVDDMVVVANGRNLAVRGPVDDLDVVLEIRRLLVPLYGVRRLDTDGLRVRPPRQEDIEVRGEIRDEEMVLSGRLSSSDQLDQLLAALARAYGEVVPDAIVVTGVDPLRVDDEARLAGFVALANSLQGPDTVAASVEVGDGMLTVSAVVRSAEHKRRVLDVAERLGAAAAVDAIGVDVDQVELDIVVEPGLVLIGGQVLTPEQRLRLRQGAEAAVGPAGVEADVILLERPPAFDGSEARIDAALVMVDRLATADITDAVVTVADGQVVAVVAANSIDSAQALRESLALPDVEVVVEVAARPVLDPAQQVAVLDAELDSLEPALGNGSAFAPDSDQLSSSGRDALRQAVPALARYPQPTVRVVVHTDSRGHR